MTRRVGLEEPLTGQRLMCSSYVERVGVICKERVTGCMKLTRKIDAADASHKVGGPFCESRTQHGFEHL